MKQENNRNPAEDIHLDDLPMAKVTREKSVSLVWIVPLIALFAGLLVGI